MAADTPSAGSDKPWRAEPWEAPVDPAQEESDSQEIRDKMRAWMKARGL